MREALIIGGGLAGGALAARLAEAGRDVLLVEKEAAPHDKVCGEFLSWEAQAYLTGLGLDPFALGAAPIDQVAVLHGRRERAARLPFTAASLSRRVLDEAVLARASEAGAEVRRGARVTALERTDGGWGARFEGEAEPAEARAVFLCTGKHDLRGLRRPPGEQSDLLGFKHYWRLTLPQAREIENRVELHLFAGGYAGLEPVEGARANLCLAVRRSTFADAGGRWEGLLARMTAACPQLAQRLTGAEPLSAKPLAIGVIPYGHVQRDSPDGLWRLGDQAAVIPSFTGEGMSLALHSAAVAAQAYLTDGTADAYARRLARDLSGQVHRATWLSQALVRPTVQAVASRVLNEGLMRTLVRRTRISSSVVQASGSSPRTRR